MTVINNDNKCLKISEIAIESMLYATSFYPSFGLVPPSSKNFNKDIDCFTFIKSSVVLLPYMNKCAKNSYCNLKPDAIFKIIRPIGIRAEEAVLKNTDNLYVDKDLIFSMGICVAAVAKAIYDGEEFINIRNIIKDMTPEKAEKELYQNNHKDSLNLNVEKMFLRYVHKGIMGEAEMGFPIIFNIALNTYDGSRDLKENDRLIQTLITIMQYAEDSTILFRHDAGVLKKVQGLSKYIIEIGGMYSENGRENVHSISKQFENTNISPKVSADLLACTVFLSKAKKAFFS